MAEPVKDITEKDSFEAWLHDAVAVALEQMEQAVYTPRFEYRCGVAIALLRVCMELER